MGIITHLSTSTMKVATRNELDDMSNALSTRHDELSNTMNKIQKQSRRNRWVGPIRKVKSRY